MLKKEDQNSWPAWATEPIEIVDPNPSWLEKGVEEERELINLLSSFGITQVVHYGSTSIPNLPAKPIIDVMAKINSFERIDQIVLLLADHDWHYVPPHLDNRPWQRLFVKVKNDKRVAHLHLLLEGEERWERQLLFRDHLRANPHLTEEYGKLKQKLAQEFNNDRETYTEAKKEFIEHVLSLASSN